MRTRWKLAVLGVAILAIVSSGLAFFALRYDPSRFKGDGIITDHGFWSFPRYEIRFPRLCLKNRETYTYECKGLPPESLRLMLEMPDSQRKRHEAAEFLRIHPNSKYAEPYDKQKYEIVSRNRTKVQFSMMVDGLSELWMAAPLQEWKLTWTPALNTGAFWHPEAEFSSNPKSNYRLIFVIHQADHEGMPEELSPVLQGGGNEFP